MKKTLVWVTPDCFMDTDILVVPRVSQYFNVHWFVLQSPHARFRQKMIDEEHGHVNLHTEWLEQKSRIRNPQRLLFYLKLCRRIKSKKPDLIYLNMSAEPWCLVMSWFFKSNQAIVTAHQGKVHLGMGHKTFVNFFRSRWYGHFHNVNMFSKSQSTLFKEVFPTANVYQFVLGLKDFGVATNQRPLVGDVRFLSFGTMNYAKNIELLIDAACLLYERGVRGFKVSINGSCKDWSWYQRRIKYPEIFELDIRIIDNSEIPNLFNGAHYLVQPYRVVSQSGPTKIAYSYNLPVIVSDLPGFTDELEEGINGFSFKCDNVESLADKMRQLIENHKNRYASLIEKMRVYTKEHYSYDTLIEQYRDMIEEMITIKEKKTKKSFSFKAFLNDSKMLLFLRLCYEHALIMTTETKHLANGNRYKNQQKMQTDLRIRVHAIEKGMSIAHLKEGFGNHKACEIIDDMRTYLSIGGDRQFILETCSVLWKYIEFKNEIGQAVTDVMEKLESFSQDYHVRRLGQGGVLTLKYEEISRMAKGNLPEVLASRYAVRDFGSRPINIGLLRKALQTAEKSPSACNRQSWRIHVYTGDKALKIFNLQGGGKSFASEMQAAMLICGDLRSYYLSELNLLYVDGGLYGMNLLLALHYYGLASIPLTMGLKTGYLKKVKHEMGLPDNEMPVLLIGVGSYKDEFRAAASFRQPYTQYTTFEE